MDVEIMNYSESLENCKSLAENLMKILSRKDESTIHRITNLCLRHNLINMNEISSNFRPHFLKSTNSKSDLSEELPTERRKKYKSSATEVLTNLLDNQAVESSVPLHTIVEQHFEEFYQFLSSGEVEGMSYENYILLYQEIQDYRHLEMQKDKKKRAFRIYEQYIKTNAPTKVKLDSEVVDYFDNLFRKVDNCLFDKVFSITEKHLNSVKTKFLSSNFYMNEKNKMEVRVHTNNLRIFKKQYFKIEGKDTLSEQLKYILRDEDLLLKFRTFLESMLCDDSLNLWLRLEHFIEYYDQYSPLEIMKVLRYYHDEFISDDSMHQIPFPYNVVEIWVNLINSKNVTNKGVVELIKITREELSKDLHNHTIDFIRVIKDKLIDPKKKINVDSMQEGVHKQLYKICNNIENMKEFLCFLESKFCSENLLFWMAIEDLRTEPREAKRREKALVYLKRFIDSEGAEAVFIPSDLQRNLINMITDKKIFLEMKPFDVVQKMIESTLQPLLLSFNNLSPRVRKNLIKDANSKKHQMLSNLKVRDHRPTFSPKVESVNDTHVLLAKLDDEKKVNKDSFLQFLIERGMKNNFMFWSEAHDMLVQDKPKKKIKQVYALYNKYIRDRSDLGLRLKSNFRQDLCNHLEQNKIENVEDIPYQLFLNLLIEVELSLSDIVDTYVSMFMSQNSVDIDSF